MASLFKTKPFQHQLEEWQRSREDETRAIWWEPGCGKSKLTIDTAAWLYGQDKIDCLFVLAPNGVHSNWVTDELPAHMLDSIPWRAFVWHSKKAKTKTHKQSETGILHHLGLAVVCMSYDGFMTKAGKAFVEQLVRHRKILMVCDESTKIKSPNAKRTRSVCLFGKKIQYKRILTGTPAHNSPFDVYSQIKFLDWDYWKERGWSTFAAFKAYFGIFEKIEVQQANKRGGTDKREVSIVVGYRHLEQLKAATDEVASRVTKDEVLDLPPKLYSKRYFELTPEQQRLYKEVRDEFITFLDGEMVTAPLIITRMLRLQQITCGYLPTDDEKLIRLEKNPRLDCLTEWMEALDHQAIIWCRFREDINWIMERHGDLCYRYDGLVGTDDRMKAKQGFQAGERQFFVANPAAGGMGLTLHAAKSVLFYSNSYSPEDREQAEDRAHRIGQDGLMLGGKYGVHYTDLAGWGTVDSKIIASLRNKFNVARQITGDVAKDWL
jgi:hypothetical protein